MTNRDNYIPMQFSCGSSFLDSFFQFFFAVRAMPIEVPTKKTRRRSNRHFLKHLYILIPYYTHYSLCTRDNKGSH